MADPLIFPEAWWPTHSLWAAMALVLVSRRGGFFSLDTLLVRARGLVGAKRGVPSAA
jgi:hypothetical protein